MPSRSIARLDICVTLPQLRLAVPLSFPVKPLLTTRIHYLVGEVRRF